MVPRRADGERLVAVALLERLVDVEGADLELRDVARHPRVAAQEQPPALPALQAPERTRVHPGAREQSLEQRANARAIADPRALGIHDQREQVLPEPHAPEQRAVAARGPARELGAEPLEADAHDGRSFSSSSIATNQSSVGASTTRSVRPPLAWFAGHTSTQVPQPMQRSCSVVIERGSAPSNSLLANVGHTLTHAPQWMQVEAGPASFSERSTR